MTIVSSKERMLRAFKTAHFTFLLAMGPTLKKYCELRVCAIQATSIASVSLRTFVSVARGSLWRGARLDAVGPSG